MVSKSQVALKWPVYRPRNWGRGLRAIPLRRPWYGLDTERDAQDGDFVCGWSAGKTDFQFNGLTDLAPGTYWVWNLPYDLEGLLRDVGIAGHDEAWAARVDGAGFELLGGKARYFHGKRFDWNNVAKGGRISMIEASAFFGRCRLSDIGAKGGIDAAKMSLTRYQTDDDYQRAVDSYCLQDARIVYNEIMKLDAGTTELGVTLGSTPGATARRFLNRMGEFSPTLWRTHTAFLRAYCGGRFEICKRGVMFDVRQYDIVSAYPWALSQCPWLTKTANHRRVNQIHQDALYGSYRVSFSFDDYMGIAPGWNNGVRVYSKAEETCWLTKPEVEWLQNAGAALKIHRGVEIFDPNATRLWRDVIGELFAIKADKKRYGAATRLGAKIIMNSAYGILIQLVRKSGEWVPVSEAKSPIDWAGTLALEEPPKEFEAGQYYAPAYASHLTALVRLRMLDAARAVGPEQYIGGHTDSVLQMGKFPLSLSSELGGWELKDSAPKADICKTGMYSVGATVKIRGITRSGTAANLWEPRQTRNIRRGIKSADSWDEVSVITPKEVMNNLAIENKRRWLGDFTPAIVAREEYLDSEALAYVC